MQVIRQVFQNPSASEIGSLRTPRWRFITPSANPCLLTRVVSYTIKLPVEMFLLVIFSDSIGLKSNSIPCGLWPFLSKPLDLTIIPLPFGEMVDFGGKRHKSWISKLRNFLLVLRSWKSPLEAFKTLRLGSTDHTFVAVFFVFFVLRLQNVQRTK